jgi:hypothetical protein
MRHVGRCGGASSAPPLDRGFEESIGNSAPATRGVSVTLPQLQKLWRSPRSHHAAITFRHGRDNRLYEFAAERRLAVMCRWIEVGVSRSYEIVSAGGTSGTSYQRLLAFTTAGQKAPAVLLAALMARYQVARPARVARRVASRA